MTGLPTLSDGERIGEVVARVQLPLENLEYTLDSYLHDNANWLDPRTRDMLVSVRESVGRVALSARALSRATPRRSIPPRTPDEAG